MTYSAAALRPLDDRAGLLALWMEVMASRSLTTVADWRFTWLFEQNPAGPATSCVTHHVESGAVVACGSAHPRATQVGGTSRSAGILGDFAVSKAHRSAGPAMAVQRCLLTESLLRFDFVYGCPNDQAEAIFKRLGYATVGETVTYSRPLRTTEKLKAHLKPAFLAELAGAIADRVLALSDLRAFLRRPFAYRTEIVARADERFDSLWQRGRGHYGITGERTAAYLNWRYADFKTAEHRFFCLAERRSGRLCGYVVYFIREDVVFIEDFFCDEPARTLEVLLLLFAARMRDGRNRSLYFSILANRWYEQALKRLLFVKRPGKRSMIVRAREGASPELVRELMDSERWFLIGGELDT